MAADRANLLTIPIGSAIEYRAILSPLGARVNGPGFLVQGYEGLDDVGYVLSGVLIFWEYCPKGKDPVLIIEQHGGVSVAKVIGVLNTHGW